MRAGQAGAWAGVSGRSRRLGSRAQALSQPLSRGLGTPALLPTPSGQSRAGAAGGTVSGASTTHPPLLSLWLRSPTGGMLLFPLD